MLIPTNLLRAVAFASGRKDIRFYLNGVRVVREGRNVTLVATDGKRMHVGAFTCGGRADQNYEVTLPIDAVRAALDTEDAVIGLRRFEEDLWALPRHVQFECVGGKYPDWKRVAGATGQPFDAGHMGDVLRAARLLVRRKPVVVPQSDRYTVAGVDNFYAILLPQPVKE